MIEWIRFILTAALLLCGLFILTVGVIGVFRFKFVLNRMHAAAMNDTLGLLFGMLAMMVSCNEWAVILKFVLIVSFMWLASPVSSHLICRLEITTNENLQEELEVRRQ